MAQLWTQRGDAAVGRFRDSRGKRSHGNVGSGLRNSARENDAASHACTRADDVSLAGFTPGAPMTYAEVAAALARARADLMRLGVRQPTAEQIQAALIGGEVHLSNGRTRMLRGTVAPQGGNSYAAR